MIIKFSSSKNEVNYGIVIDRHPGGMVCVRWDEFTQLLSRLESNGARISDFVRIGLSKRTSWVRVESNMPNGAAMELLPITTKVPWTDNELSELQSQITKEN